MRIALRRLAEATDVLTTELGRAFVADAVSRRRCVKRLAQHQAAGLLESRLLRVLQRTHRCHRVAE